MKIFAYYLPQFHCIPENDKWWGKGFTEWTNVKKAKSLYKGHLQPKVPLNDNYYDLTNVNTLEWQEKLLNDYNVDGLIFYHYYFKGKKLLEKPSELLLKNKNINIDFFFCWANHDWYRSWNDSKEMLQKQEYGNEEDWEKHFLYLLEFFKDERYQKRNNKPILMIFNTNFKEKKDMFKYFDIKCKENGFDGLCLIETIATYDTKQIDEFNEKMKCECTEFLQTREPSCSIDCFESSVRYYPNVIFNKVKTRLNKHKFKVIKKYNGNILYKLMIKNYSKNKKIIRGSFFEWDNTPRHGYRGYIITPPRKKIFMKYMNVIKNEDFLFINAWNEWCEGMILEPTVENKYKYLEWINEFKNNETINCKEEETRKDEKINN